MTMQRVLSVLMSSLMIFTQLAACAPKPTTAHMFDSRVQGDEDGDTDDSGDDEGGDDGSDSQDGEGFESDKISTDSEGNPSPSSPKTPPSTEDNVGYTGSDYSPGERAYYWGEDGQRYSGVVIETINGGNSFVLDPKTIREEDGPASGVASVKEGEPMTKESEEFFEDKAGPQRKGGNDPESPKDTKPGLVSKNSLNNPSTMKEFREFMKNEREAIKSAVKKTTEGGEQERAKSRSESKNYTSAHNEGVDALSKALPGAKSAGKAQSIKTPEGSPLGDSMRRTARYISYVENEGNGDKKLTGLARKTLEKADEKAQNGDLSGADKRRKAAQDLTDAAACQGCKPPPAGPAPKDLEPPSTFDANKERSYAYDMSTGMYETANDLDDVGLPEVANETRKTAAKIMNVALGLARMSNLLDIPMSAAEAFGGVTVDVDDDGNPRVRDATNIERAIAGVSLGLIAGAAVLGAGVGGVVAAGIIGKIGKVIRGAEKSHALEKAALEAAEKGLVGAEKEALEKAAAELAEKNADDIVEAATDAGTHPPKTGKVENPENLSELGKEVDRNGFTKAGRAIQKHQSTSRPGSGTFPQIKGRPESYNKAGQEALEGILKDPSAVSSSRHHARLGDITEIRLPDGSGARFGNDGFMGFLEPGSGN